MGALRRLAKVLVLGSTVASMAVFAPRIARAQTTMPPNDRTFDVQLFDPALGTHSFLTVSGAELLDQKQFQIMVGVTYMTDPLTVYNVDASNNLTTRTNVVSSIVAANLSAAYGFRTDLMLGVSLPAILSERGDGLDVATGSPQAGGLSVSGVGDLKLELTYKFFSHRGFSLAGTLGGTVPTSKAFGSSEVGFIGDTLPTFRPRLAAQWTSQNGKFSAGVNLGAIFRDPRMLYSSEVGQQLTYGAGAAYHFTRNFDLVGEVFGRSGFDASLDEAPLEGDLAIRVSTSQLVTVMLGGGAGLVKGVGSPGLRLFAQLNWAPDYGDNDGDGIDNAHDLCPNEPEDFDGFQDADGCPDPDNDGDGIPDALDKCPNEPEDKDGFQDEDGCPDPDNDQDGIPDEKDACPNEPGPPENHGCPIGKTGVLEVAPNATPTPEAAPPVIEITPNQPVPSPIPAPIPAPTPAPSAQSIAPVFSGAIEFSGARPRHSSHNTLNDAARDMTSRPEVKRWRVTVVAENHKKPSPSAARSPNHAPTRSKPTSSRAACAPGSSKPSPATTTRSA